MKKISLVASIFCLCVVANLHANDEESDYVVTVKTNSQVVDTAGSFSVVSQDEIKKINADSMQKVLENTVGISVTANSRSINGRKNITFRGMDSKHTAILIDGNRVSNTDAQIGHSDFQYDWIPVDQIQKVEVVRGPMSSLYGSKALGGVINIITKKPKDSFNANIDTKFSFPDGGEGKSKGISAYAAKRFDKFSFSLSAEKKVKDEVQKIENGVLNSEFEGLDVLSGNLKLGYDLSESSDISLSLLQGKEYRESTVAGKHYDKYYDIDKGLYSLAFNQQTHFGGFNIKGNWTRSKSYSAQVTKTHTLEDKALSTEFYADILPDHYIVVGAEYKKDSYKAKYDKDTYKPHPLAPVELPAVNFKGDTDNISFYAQDEISFMDKFLLTIGGRYDYHSQFHGQLSPKAYLVYRLADNHRLKTGYGKGFNAPTITQNSDDYSALNMMGTSMSTDNLRMFKGNSDLKPEITDTYELGYEYFDDLHSFKLTGFYNDISNLITTSSTGARSEVLGLGVLDEKYVNVASATTSGFELEFTRRSLLPNLGFGFYYTYLHSKDKDKHRELNFRPEHKVNVNLDYDINDMLQTSLRYSYTGKQKNYRDEDKEVDTLKGFSTLSLQVSAKTSKDFTIRGGIDNILDEKLDEAYNYQLPDRTYYIGVNYKF
ncbi:MAG: hypothetical protein CR967_05540 [Proteobacteria bacterium]|nr:MAG: hypothetical protein CR967_05540 [Pseudomonadota bacterium]